MRGLTGANGGTGGWPEARDELVRLCLQPGISIARRWNTGATRCPGQCQDLYSLVENCLCRTRHRQVHAGPWTIPGGGRQAFPEPKASFCIQHSLCALTRLVMGRSNKHEPRSVLSETAFGAALPCRIEGVDPREASRPIKVCRSPRPERYHGRTFVITTIRSRTPSRTSRSSMSVNQSLQDDLVGL